MDTITVNAGKTNDNPWLVVPWHVKARAKMETWYLRKFRKLDTSCERIVRFYTYNDEQGKDFEFKCPQYAYDQFSGLYDDTVEVCSEIGQQLQNFYGDISGRYFYDIKVSLTYLKTISPFNGIEEWENSYSCEIMNTDNPKCWMGNPKRRRDCRYLTSKASRLTIEGYHLNGRYTRMSEVLSDLVNKVIIVHSVRDARAVLRMLKFLGVHTIKVTKYHYNNPNKYGAFSRNIFGYGICRENGETIAVVMPRSDLPVAPDQILDIDELIVKRDLKARLRDWRGKAYG